MLMYIARSKKQDSHILTGEYYPIDLLKPNGTPNTAGYGWTKENQDGTLPKMSEHYTFNHPSDVYKFVRRALRDALGNATYGFSKHKYTAQELTDKEFQKDYFKLYGDNITLETYEVNMRTGKIDKIKSEDLSVHYPKRISSVHA